MAKHGVLCNILITKLLEIGVCPHLVFKKGAGTLGSYNVLSISLLENWLCLASRGPGG